MVFVAITIVILLVAAAFAIDFAHIHVTRAELRTATDAAARAGSEALSRTGNVDLARQAAIDIASQNVVAGKPLQLRGTDIEFGGNLRSSNGKIEFVPNQQPFDTVRVTGDRTQNSLSGSVPMLFGPIFGVTEFEPMITAASTRASRDIALVLDVSGSMSSFGRFDALRDAFNIFLFELEQSGQRDQISLSVYSTNSTKLHPMTPNHQSVRNAFANATPNGFTAIGEGILMGLSTFSDPLARSNAQRIMIVMTDGIHNRGVSPLVAVQQASAANITVHTITFSPSANRSLMQQVAQQTGGIYLHAETNADLVDAFRDMARLLPIVLIE